MKMTGTLQRRSALHRSKLSAPTRPLGLITNYIVLLTIITLCNSTGADEPIVRYSQSEAIKQRVFYLDSVDHYMPNEDPSLDQVVFWNNFVFLTAKDNIFKLFRNSTHFYHFRYSMSLPQSEKCTFSKEICQRRVKFLLPYEKSSLLGCYAYSLEPHFFTLNGSDFRSLPSSDPLANSLRKFCSVDPNVEALVFGEGAQSFTYFLAQGIPKSGFELRRISLQSPAEMKSLLNSSSSTALDMFSLPPGVEAHITTNNLRDKSRILGKSYPVTQFSFNGSVFVTFREPAVELSGVQDYKDTLFSRIAKVCKQDRGSAGFSYSPIEHWTSFAKTRLICSIPGTPEFLFNEVQDTVLFDSGNGFLFGIFDTPYTEMRSSAICLYDLRSVTESFAGKHYNAPVFEPPAQRNADIIKDYKPSTCTNRSKDIDSSLVTFLQTYTLMDEPVRPVNDEPVFRVSGASFRLITITGEEAKWLSVNNSKVFILYAGTDDGRVLKLAVNMSFSEGGRQSVDTIWVADWQLFQSSVALNKVLIDSVTDHLFTTSASQVAVLPKAKCPTNPTSCRDCLRSRDPHCNWDIVSASCVYSPGPSPNVSFNAFAMYPRMEEVCSAFDQVTQVQTTSAAVPIADFGSKTNLEDHKMTKEGAVTPSEQEDESGFGKKDDSVANVASDGEITAIYPTEPTLLGGANGKSDGMSSTEEDKGEAAMLEVLDASAGEKQTKKDKRLLTITLVTAIPCVILGILAGMGFLYCFALYKTNKHSRVSKSSPNELIYAPIVIGKSPSGSSEAQHGDGGYMYQQYAQYLQIDPQAEEKHYSTIGSVQQPIPESIASCNNLVNQGTLTRNGYRCQELTDSLLTTSGYASQQPSGFILTNDSGGYSTSRLTDNHLAEKATTASASGAGSLSRLNGSNVFNMPSQNHIQSEASRLNAQFPQHHTVAPTTNSMARAPPRQLQQLGSYNLPQSHSMMNYSHTQLNNPGNLLRDSNQLLTKPSNYTQQQAAPPSRFRSETKLFQPRTIPSVNNTYGEDHISSKSLLFPTGQVRVAPSESSSSSHNLPVIRRPTSVKYSKVPTAGKHNGSNAAVDPLLGSAMNESSPKNPPQRFRSDSMQHPSTSSVYRSDFDLNEQHLRRVKGQGQMKASPRCMTNENRLAMQYGVQTSENPLYGAPDYQSQFPVCPINKLFLSYYPVQETGEIPQLGLSGSTTGSYLPFAPDHSVGRLSMTGRPLRSSINRTLHEAPHVILNRSQHISQFSEDDSLSSDNRTGSMAKMRRIPLRRSSMDRHTVYWDSLAI